VQNPATCPACGGPLAVWRAVPASDPALDGSWFALARCARCGSAVTLGDVPAGLHEAGAYRPGDPRLYALARPLLGRFDRQRLELVRALAAPPARLLDAGAGRGRFVAAARHAGYDALGIEPAVRGPAPPQVERVGIEDAGIEPGSVDVVTLWHVLEHLDQPAAALDRIASWLRPGGGLVVGVPNLASLQSRIGGERWYHLDVPRHRVHFTPDGLHALLRSRGFTVQATRHTLLEHNPFGMWQTLVNRVTRQHSYAYNALKRNAPLRSPDLAISLTALAAAPAAAALELLAGVRGRGGTIAVLAQST
jgi:2-polyprenyl-3-methyl-5-hydroxy-6-metoxy-1,4-benzoquinol methylase